MIGKTIEKRRKFLQMTQAQIASKVGCVRQTVSKAEKDENIESGTLLSILRELGLELEIRCKEDRKAVICT